MAKGNMLLGLSRGSVGDLTFYRRNAQQITRVRVRKVKNPQSASQMYQRTINRTAVEAYTVLKSICDHSFEGVSYGANSYSYFLSRNMQMLRSEADNTAFGQRSYVPKDFKGIVAMPFLISSGSLPSIRVDVNASSSLYGAGLLMMTIRASGSAEAITYAQVAQALNAQQGDQVTLLRIGAPAQQGFPDEPLGRKLDVARFILDPRVGEFDETPFFSPIAGAENVYGINTGNIRNEGNLRFEVTSGSGVFSVIALVGEEVIKNFGGAAILSRQTPDGSWLRSNAYLDYDESYRENGYTIKQASTLTPVDLYVESDYYLNNAE